MKLTTILWLNRKTGHVSRVAYLTPTLAAAWCRTLRAAGDVAFIESGV